MSVAATIRLSSCLLVVLGALSPSIKGAVLIDWSAPGVTFTTINATQAVVIGTTTGDAAIPFTATFNTVGSTLNLSRGTTGNTSNIAIINHPPTRNSTTLTTITISLTGYRCRIHPLPCWMSIGEAPVLRGRIC